MKFTFDKIYFTGFTLLFVIEVIIAFFLKDGFVRHTVGDFLVVILLYCLFKSFLKTHTLNLAILTLGIAYLIEFLQLTAFLNYLGLKQNKWANLVFGNTFSIQDLVANTLGIVVVLFIEIRGQRKKKLREVNSTYE